MNERDKAILGDLQRFRCMTRDDIAELHFGNVKHPITQSNIVLKRLRRDGHIECATDRRMYIYFPTQSIKKDSTKIPHYLAIVDFYKQIIKTEMPKIFEVEPKVGEKGSIEPDIFMIWQRAPFFVEIQRSIYTQKVMDAKIKRYENYFFQESWKKAVWQPHEKKVFPRIWIITERDYIIETPLRVIQTKDTSELMSKV